MEAQWLKEEAKLRAEEEKWLQEEKLRKQKAAKRSREVSIRLKKEKEVGSHLCMYLNITLCVIQIQLVISTIRQVCVAVFKLIANYINFVD